MPAGNSSSDKRLKKMNLITENESTMWVQESSFNSFLEMCKTTSAAAEAAYTALNEKISQLLDSSEFLHNCTSIGVDNTSANISIRNSLKTKIIPLNDSRYRRSPTEVFLEKDVLKISSKFTGEHPSRSAISIKLPCLFTFL